MKEKQQNFQRRELKYLLTDQQRGSLEAAFTGLMQPDLHGESTICNIYWDTPDYRLIRRSLEKPAYKEKLRFRSYGQVKPEDDIFMELKKKYGQIVYKRRICLPEQQARGYFLGKNPLPPSHIAEEIDYFRRFYAGLRPAMYLCYDRTAYYGRFDPGLRVTFDRNILWREQELSLTMPCYGQPLLLPEQSLMEIKAEAALPLWLAELLSEQHIYQVSYSKYGKAYLNKLQKGMQGGVCCA